MDFTKEKYATQTWTSFKIGAFGHLEFKTKSAILQTTDKVRKQCDYVYIN